MTDSTPTDMSTMLAAITGLSNQMLKMDSDMKGEIKEIKDQMFKMDSKMLKMDGKIKEIKNDVDKLKRDVHKTRIMSGSLVETNIRSYFIKEYGESFSRQYTAIDLSPCNSERVTKEQ